MDNQAIKLLTILTASVLYLSGCGEGINSVTGTAATGAPIANAKVYIVDSQGQGPTGQDESKGIALITTDANGKYAVPNSLVLGLKPPFMVRVVGDMVSDTGDKAPAQFHAITASSGFSTVNVTPLTEAHAALTLGAQPAAAFGSSSALSAVSSAALVAANSKLAQALAPVADFSVAPNFVSDPLDATPGASTSSSARKHDATLDQLSVSVSNGKIILADRNQDDDKFVTGPRVEIVAATQQVVLPAGSISAKPEPLDLQKVKDFAARFTTQFAVGCVLDAEPVAPAVGLCDAVTNPSNKVFHANFKDKGTTPWRWMSGWLTDAFETTDLTGVTVSVVSANYGSFVLDNGQRVYRVLLKFTKGNDVVMRPMLVIDNDGVVTSYGNQKDFFFYMAPRINYKVDASGQYPYYPKYESGMNVIVKHWFGSKLNVIVGAHVKGPGLPASRQVDGATVNGLKAGVDVNRNNVSEGIEVFDRRSSGCNAFPVDTSVYVERNTASWANRNFNTGNIRWRPDSTSCNPLFDLLRYDANREVVYQLPKKGDVYTVTLYLDKSKYTTPPAGVGAERIVKNIEGVSYTVYPYVFNYTLAADAFPLPDANFNPASFGFPGIADTSRTNLARLSVNDDLSISWARNKIVQPDGAVFGSFYVGRYMSSYDQWRTYESGDVNFTYDDGSKGENYADFTKYNHGTGSTISDVYVAANCGKTTATKFRNGSVVTIPLIKKVKAGVTTYTSTTCAGATADLASAQASDPSATISIVYSNQRFRKQYVSDRGRLVATNDKDQILRFSDLLSREASGNLNLCSAYDGFIRSRQVYVQLADINGRQIMEMRDVWWDYPDMKRPQTAGSGSQYTNAEAISGLIVDRPNLDTDPLYLPLTSTGKTNYDGARGFVHSVKYKSGTSCATKVW